MYKVHLWVKLWRMMSARVRVMWAAIPTEAPPGRDCSEAEFRCDDGTCIELRYHCDREYHCPDGTDEFHCGQSVDESISSHTVFIPEYWHFYNLVHEYCTYCKHMRHTAYTYKYCTLAVVLLAWVAWDLFPAAFCTCDIGNLAWDNATLVSAFWDCQLSVSKC